MSGLSASSAVQQAVEDTCTTMQAALAALKDSRDASCPAPSRQQVQASVQLLRMEVAKMGLLYNQPSTPTDEEAAALLHGFQEAASTLCMLYTGLAAAGGGPTLRASLHQAATAVVEACAALIRGAVVGGAHDAQLRMLSGFSLEMLEAAGKAPLDNRTAIGRAIALVLKQLADAQKELDEVVQSAQAEAGEVAVAVADPEDGEECGATALLAANCQPANGTAIQEEDCLDSAFGFEDEAFSGEQLVVVQHVHGMLSAVVALVKAVMKQLLAEREGLGEEAVDGWESMLYHVKTLTPLCDDLSAGTYPPQDAKELASAAEALATSCELLVEECPVPSPAAAVVAAPAGDDDEQQQQQQGGAAALQESMQAVQQAHQQLVQQLALAMPAQQPSS